MEIIETKRLRLEPISTQHAAMVFEPLQSELIYIHAEEPPPCHRRQDVMTFSQRARAQMDPRIG